MCRNNIFFGMNNFHMRMLYKFCFLRKQNISQSYISTMLNNKKLINGHNIPCLPSNNNKIIIPASMSVLYYNNLTHVITMKDLGKKHALNALYSTELNAHNHKPWILLLLLLLFPKNKPSNSSFSIGFSKHIN